MMKIIISKRWKKYPWSERIFRYSDVLFYPREFKSERNIQLFQIPIISGRHIHEKEYSDINIRKKRRKCSNSRAKEYSDIRKNIQDVAKEWGASNTPFLISSTQDNSGEIISIWNSPDIDMEFS
jgi:hypothetical protein